MHDGWKASDEIRDAQQHVGADRESSWRSVSLRMGVVPGHSPGLLERFVADVMIEPAKPGDAAEILSLQKRAYLSEATIYEDYSLPPLVQTLEEISTEFGSKLFLKAVENGALVGSVRGYCREGTTYLERLIVHPTHQGRGIGSLLARTFEASFPEARRFELFTGHKSERNITLYRRLGYVPYRRDRVHPGLELVYLEKVVK